MAKEDIGKRVIVTPAWLEIYDEYAGDYRGKEGTITGFRLYSDMTGHPDETSDDDGVYFILVETGDEIRVRRFDFEFGDDE